MNATTFLKSLVEKSKRDYVWFESQRGINELRPDSLLLSLGDGSPRQPAAALRAAASATLHCNQWNHAVIIQNNREHGLHFPHSSSPPRPALLRSPPRLAPLLPPGRSRFAGNDLYQRGGGHVGGLALRGAACVAAQILLSRRLLVD